MMSCKRKTSVSEETDVNEVFVRDVMQDDKWVEVLLSCI